MSLSTTRTKRTKLAGFRSALDPRTVNTHMSGYATPLHPLLCRPDLRIGCLYTYYIHKYIHTYIHTYVHTYIHTHRLKAQGFIQRGGRDLEFPPQEILKLSMVIVVLSQVLSNNFVPDCVRSNLRGSKFKIFLGEGGHSP